jgi:hypothetical protein
MSSVLGGETVREAAERARWRVTQRRRAEVDAAAATAAAEEARPMRTRALHEPVISA